MAGEGGGREAEERAAPPGEALLRWTGLESGWRDSRALI